jgi:hypothetical protein
MSKKTAMQELVEYFKKDTTTMRDFYVRFMSRRYELIEQEKQQMIEFAKWCDNNYNTLEVYNVADLLELYNKTFKSE